MLGEPLVQERVVRSQQIEHTSVFANDAVEEEFRLAPERLAQVVIKVRKYHWQGPDALHAAQIQPLPGEVDCEGLRARIRQHSPDLLLEHRRILEFSLAGDVDQLIVRARTPQEE